MRSTMIRTAAVTSMVTAFAVSSFRYFVLPHLAWNSQPQAQAAPAVNPANATNANPQDQTATNSNSASATSVRHYSDVSDSSGADSQPAYTAHNASYHRSGPGYSSSDQSGEPEVRRPRSKEKSALIVGAAAGTGAAIGAIAGGGKGAGIGALAGGAAGFIYDRATAHPH
jgi:hypothetical protein